MSKQRGLFGAGSDGGITGKQLEMLPTESDADFAERCRAERVRQLHTNDDTQPMFEEPHDKADLEVQPGPAGEPDPDAEGRAGADGADSG